MTSVLRIEGYVILSADGMLADASGIMPPQLKFDADQKFFEAALDRADLIVHGRPLVRGPAAFTLAHAHPGDARHSGTRRGPPPIQRQPCGIRAARHSRTPAAQAGRDIGNRGRSSAARVCSRCSWIATTVLAVAGASPDNSRRHRRLSRNSAAVAAGHSGRPRPQGNGDTRPRCRTGRRCDRVAAALVVMRGALATKQSSFHLRLKTGLLRLARNDGSKAESNAPPRNSNARIAAVFHRHRTRIAATISSPPISDRFFKAWIMLLMRSAPVMSQKLWK